MKVAEKSHFRIFTLKSLSHCNRNLPQKNHFANYTFHLKSDPKTRVRGVESLFGMMLVLQRGEHLNIYNIGTTSFGLQRFSITA